MKPHKLTLAALTAMAALSLETTLPAQSLIHRYSFNDANTSSTTFVDSVGGADGSIMGSAYLDGSQLQLDGQAGSYGALPAGMVSGLSQVTIEFWASFDAANAVWSRVFAFGDQNGGGGANTSLDYCHYAGGNWQNLNYQTPDGNGYANNPGGLNGMTNVHVTVVVDPVNHNMYYYNGTTLVSTLHNSVPPLSGLNDTYGLIGRSLFDVDPALIGSIDEFRIYSGVVPLATVALDDASGPNQIVTNTGAIQTVHLTTPASSIVVNANLQLGFTGDFANVSNVDLIAYGGAGFTSDQPGVLTVNSTNGLVHAVAQGTATITGSYGTVSNSVTISVIAIPATLTHRYSFAGTADDSVGTANGTLNGSATVSGGQLVLDGADGSYLDLPADGINIATNKAITLEAWATVDAANGTWARLFEFGDGTGGADFFCAPQVQGGFNHWAITENFGAGSQNLDRAHTWSGTTAHHTWVIEPATGRLESYVNGVLDFAVQNATAALSGVSTNVAWLGRSPFADPYLIGSLDEFRIYSGALSPQEIAMTELNGPNSTNRDPGALQSISVPNQTVPAFASLLAPSILAHYANLSSFSLLPNVSAGAVNGLMLSSSDTNVLTFNANGMATTYRPGEVTVTATYLGQTASGTFTVVNRGVLTHRYSFATDASDFVGHADGTNNGTAAETGGSLVLDGSADGYLSLPANLLSNYDAVTIDTWVTLNAGGTWGRLWFFGDNQANEFYLAPVTTSGNTHRISAGVRNGATADDNPDWQNQSIHITTVFGNGSLVLYSNGVPVRTFTGLVGSLDQVGESLAWIGKSPYNDPFMNCSVDEFRIYQGQLSPEEIAASDLLGPDQLLTTNVTLQATPTGATTVLTWPGAAAGFAVQVSSNLTSGWVTLTNVPTLTGDTNWTVTVPATGSQQFFRLRR